MDNDDKIFAAGFIVWLIAAIFIIAFWCLVGYGIWTGIEYLQRH